MVGIEVMSVRYLVRPRIVQRIRALPMRGKNFVALLRWRRSRRIKSTAKSSHGLRLRNMMMMIELMFHLTLTKGRWRAEYGVWIGREDSLRRSMNWRRTRGAGVKIVGRRRWIRILRELSWATVLRPLRADWAKDGRRLLHSKGLKHGLGGRGRPAEGTALIEGTGGRTTGRLCESHWTGQVQTRRMRSLRESCRPHVSAKDLRRRL